jgi:hypothetical protein
MTDVALDTDVTDVTGSEVSVTVREQSSNHTDTVNVGNGTNSYTLTGYSGGSNLRAEVTIDGTSSVNSISASYAVQAPSQPQNVSLTYDADDQLTLDWDEVSDWGGEVGDYEIRIWRRDSDDSASTVTPSGGAGTVSGGSSSYSETYGPNSDNSYESQVGIDSKFQMLVRAYNSAGYSSWNYSNNVYTSPIPPHNPSVSRPDANTIEISWGIETSMAGRTIIYYREDTGSGYGNRQWYDTVTGGESHVSGTYSTGNRVTATYNVGQSYQSGDILSEDARYQFRLRHQDPSNTRNGELVYADYGNNGNVYFSDDFEDQDLAEWDYVVQDANIASGGRTDAGVSGSDSGSYYCQLDAGGRIDANLPDLSNESDVIVKCAFAQGSLDAASESGYLEWYDGSSWNVLRNDNWEYNKQGWYEVTALVPDSYLGSDNTVRFRQPGGGGDYTLVDRVVVSDILHEYTKPAQPSNLSLDNTVTGEITASWNNTPSFADHYDPNHKKTSESTVSHNSWQQSPATITGLGDGEEYYVEVRANANQDRNGINANNRWRSDYVSSTTITRFPANTSLSVSNITTTSADLSWTNGSSDADAQRVYARQTGSGAGMKIDSDADEVILPTEPFEPLFVDALGTIFVRMRVESVNNTDKWSDLITFGSNSTRLERYSDQNEVAWWGSNDIADKMGNFTVGESFSTGFTATSSGQKGYRDGNKVSETPTSALYNSAPSTVKISIDGGFFDWVIEELAIYDRDLSGSEMSDLHNGNTPTSGLRGHWMFDINNSGTTPDVSEFANDGTVNGPTLVGNTPNVEATPGRFRSSESDTINADAATGAIPLNGPITVTMWQKATTIRDSSSIEAYDSNNSRVLNAHAPWGDGTIYWDYGDGSTDRVEFNPSDDLTNWHHYGFTVDPSAPRMAIYLDGTLIDEQTDVGKAITTEPSVLTIGSNAPRDGTFYDGYIGDVAIYSSELTGGEISSVMAGNVLRDDCTLWVPNNRAPSGNIYDLSGSGYTLTNSGVEYGDIVTSKLTGAFLSSKTTYSETGQTEATQYEQFVQSETEHSTTRDI